MSTMTNIRKVEWSSLHDSADGFFFFLKSIMLVGPKAYVERRWCVRRRFTDYDDNEF
jgi:hypothetical protein